MTPEKQLAGFLAKFSPEVARLGKAALAKMHKRFPSAIQMVYDNYNFLVILAATCIDQYFCNGRISLNKGTKEAVMAEHDDGEDDSGSDMLSKSKPHSLQGKFTGKHFSYRGELQLHFSNLSPCSTIVC